MLWHFFYGNHMIVLVTSSCSHKKKVLEFLDQLCSFYELTYILASSVAADSAQAFIDKVCEFAEANGLSSKAYRASLAEYSDEKMRNQLSKVHKHHLSLGHQHFALL